MKNLNSSNSSTSPLSLYFHIPFCRHACSYCDFFFVVDKHKEDFFFQALSNELRLYRKYFLSPNTTVSSIYFGGGTPSWVHPKHIKFILEEVRELFNFQSDFDGIEITLEANPDDLNEERLWFYESAGINRLSIGIQSFHDTSLRYLERTHDPGHAEKSLRLAEKHYMDGRLKSWSMDLIYGIPALSDKKWQEQLYKALEYAPPHLSLYALTVESQTPLAHHIAKQKKLSPSDNAIEQQFLLASKSITGKGYEHYEISNFSIPGHYGKHNLSYWRSQEYLGLGPGAHSFLQGKRFYNFPKLQTYNNFFNQEKPSIESRKDCLGELEKKLASIRKVETLTTTAKFNEYILVGLRTKWGINLNDLEKQFSEINIREELQAKINRFKIKGWVKQRDEDITLTISGQMVSDFICRELFKREL